MQVDLDFLELQAITDALEVGIGVELNHLKDLETWSADPEDPDTYHAEIPRQKDHIKFLKNLKDTVEVATVEALKEVED